MGFAKYHEDIVSRFVYDNLMRHDNITFKPIESSKKKSADKAIVQQIKKRTSSMSSSNLKSFAISSPRPLPVIVLADTSGSMAENGKIEALNASLKEMIATFSKESRLRAEIQVGLITFGGVAETHLPLTAANSVTGFEALNANGSTPMGVAFELAIQLLEDKELIPSRAYRPILILLSDGQPTDDWEPALKALCESERAQKATRFAMAIGPDADEGMLREFANDVEAPIFKAHNARDIHRFFKAVTMSVTTRTTSQNPDCNVAFVVPPPDDDALDLDF
jgi:uncharacterized protein YegL